MRAPVHEGDQHAGAGGFADQAGDAGDLVGLHAASVPQGGRRILRCATK